MKQFTTLKFDLFNFGNLVLDNKNDPEENFYNGSHFTDTNYVFNRRS